MASGVEAPAVSFPWASQERFVRGTVLGRDLLLPVCSGLDAGVQDSSAGRAALLEQAAADHHSPRRVWVDGGYGKHFIDHTATLGIDIDIRPHGPPPYRREPYLPARSNTGASEPHAGMKQQGQTIFDDGLCKL